MARRRIQQLLLDWYRVHGRELPWRDVPNPYAVLVSEFMLQQTQVSRVVPVYDTFLRSYPSIRSLARAPRGDVIASWKGLGYNRRAVALHRTAVTVVSRHSGVLPADFDQLCALPGVGEYTARAVLAFGFGHDDAPVDTNVRRVLTRAVVGHPTTPAALRESAQQLVPAGQGRSWNAALMDLGSACCTARAPDCKACPLRAECRWSTTGGDDPAASRPRRPTGPFVGSERWHRGRLLDRLRAGPLPGDALAAGAQLDDPERAAGVAAALVADGLAEWHGTQLRLPG